MSKNAIRGLLALSMSMFSAPAPAQVGYQLEQYEPTPAGEWFFAVPAPWYTDHPALAVGLTFDYGHNPLLGGYVDSNGNFSGRPVVAHQLLGHLDVAASLLDRLQLHASAPLVLLERGTPGFGVTPNGSVTLGDPRLGLMFRAWNRAESDPVSLHVGASMWIPVGTSSVHAGDQLARGLFHAVLAGRAAQRIRWSFDAGVLLRRNAALNALENGPGTSGPGLRLGAAAAYTDAAGRLNIGPEVTFGTVFGSNRFFQLGSSHLEVLLGAQYRVLSVLQVGAAVGAGVVRSAGTPDVRGILRVAYVPPPMERSGRAEEPAPVVSLVEEKKEEPPPAIAAAPEKTEEPVPPVEEKREEPPSAVAAAPEKVEEPAPTAAALPVLYFETNQETPNADSSAAVGELARLIKASGQRVRIEGHSDDTGPAGFNQDLSDRRARYVLRQLRALGVPGERMKAVGLGASVPAGGARAKNRRVEVLWEGK